MNIFAYKAYKHIFICMLISLTTSIESMVRQKTLRQMQSTRVITVKSKKESTAIALIIDTLSPFLATPLINIIIFTLYEIPLTYLPALIQQEEAHATNHDSHLIDICKLSRGDIITSSKDHLELYEPSNKRTTYVPFANGGALCAFPHNSFAAAQLTQIQLFSYNEQKGHYSIEHTLENGDPVIKLQLLHGDKLRAISKTTIRTWDIETQKLICTEKISPREAERETISHIDYAGQAIETRISRNPQKLKLIIPKTNPEVCIMVERFKWPASNVVSLDSENFTVLAGNKIISFAIDPKALSACTLLEPVHHRALENIIHELEHLAEKQQFTVEESDPVLKKIGTLPGILQPLKYNLKKYLERLDASYVIVASSPQNACCVIA